MKAVPRGPPFHVSESRYLARPMHFDAKYSEHATLRDGSAVTIRLVRANDKALLRAGFHKLSDESRYRRFHTPKNALSDAELRYLTEIDTVTHFAIGAVRAREKCQDHGETTEEGLGLARFIVLPENGAAEAAITVLDDVHGLGLGRLLFHRLVAAARERGLAQLHCEVLASNKPMQELARQFDDVTLHRAG